MRVIERYISQPLIDQAVDHLKVYRQYGDEECRRALVSIGLQVLAGIAIEFGWEDAKKDERPRGEMTACVEAAIDDACGWSSRPTRWLECKKWRPRYDALRACFLELIIGESGVVK